MRRPLTHDFDISLRRRWLIIAATACGLAAGFMSAISFDVSWLAVLGGTLWICAVSGGFVANVSDVYEVVIADAWVLPPLVLLAPPDAAVALMIGAIVIAGANLDRSWDGCLNVSSWLFSTYLPVIAMCFVIDYAAPGMPLAFIGLLAAAMAVATNLLFAWLFECTRMATWVRLEEVVPRNALIAVGIGALIEIPIIVAAVILAQYAIWAAFLVYTPIIVSTIVARAKARSDETQAHLRASFARYIPPSMVDALIESRGDIELGGSERDVSVLFCDIRGFTAWAEQHPAAVVVEELNQLLGELAAAVFSTGGTLDKYTGDGLMAFWGAPLEQPDHAERAVVASARMISNLAQQNERRREAGLPPFEIGIGVASGPAVVGNVGHEARHDYTAMGDTVNTAARLEAATKEHDARVIVAASTWDRLPLPARDRSSREISVTVKGKALPVSARALMLRGETPIPVEYPEDLAA